MDLNTGQPITSSGTTSQSQPNTWRIIANLDLLWRDWDEDEVVVFSQGLGHSYLLNAPSARILQALAEAAPAELTLTELANYLSSCCSPETSHADIHDLLDVTLPEFYRIGLAEPTVSHL